MLTSSLFTPERLREVIEEAGLSYRQNSKSYIFTCPKCEKKDKLYLRKTDGRFVCFVCKETENFQGRPEFALAELMEIPLSEVRDRLYGYTPLVHRSVEERLTLDLYDFYGDTDEIEEDVTPTIPTAIFPPDFYPIDHPHSAKGLHYLQAERGISLEIAKRYNLRYCPPTRRVIFPVEVDGRLIGWQARATFKTEIWDEESEIIRTVPKILGNKGLRREISLMFADRLKGSDHAVVCEGPIDGLKAHLCGGNCVTMGKAVSQAQIKLILASGVKKVYLALDPDAASEMQRLCRAFSDLSVYQVLPPPHLKDLGAATEGQIYHQFLRAPRVDATHLFLYLRR